MASKTCFKRSSTVVLSSISVLSPRSISGTRTRNSLHTLSRKYLNCCADFASLIHCSSGLNFLSLIIKSLSTPSTASSRFTSGSTFSSSGGGGGVGSSIMITSFSTRGFCLGGCSMTSSLSLRILLIPFTRGLKTIPHSLVTIGQLNLY